MRFRSAIIAWTALFASALSSQAQTSIWNFTNGNWTTGTDWTSGSVPANDGSVNIKFNVVSLFSSTLDVNYSVASVDVQVGLANFNLLGTSTLTVGAGGFTDSSALNVDVYPILAGPMDLDEISGGTLTLHANNTYTGNTNISSGTLADAMANAFSPNSLLQVALGGTVDVNNNENVLGLNNFGSGGSVVIAGGATLAMNGGLSTTFSGAISGGGNLQQNGASTLTLTGTNTYTGTTTIGPGSTINLGGGGITGSIASPTVTGAGSLSFDLAVPTSYAGDLIGSLNVVQQGFGTTTLFGVNTYSGPTTINAGVLTAGSNTAFGTNSTFTLNGTGSLKLNGFSDGIGSLAGGAGTSVQLGNGTLSITNIFAGAGIFNGVISGAGGSINMGGYVLDLTNENLYTGGTTISAGTLEVDNNPLFGSGTGAGSISIMPGGVLQLGSGGGDTNGSVNTGSAITDNGNVTFARADVFTFPNTITGTGSLTQIGHGTVTLTGNNSYSGTTTVQSGTLTANSTNALGNGLSDVDLVAGGRLNLNSSSAVVGSISGDSSATIDLGSSSLTTGASNLTTTFAGQLQGSGQLIVVGTGMTILTGNSAYNGPVTIPGSAATLQVGDGVTAGASIANVNTITDAGTLGFAPALTDNITYNFNISGSGALTVAGPGKITLRGNNNISGLTSVTGGTLADGGGNAFSASSPMQVGSGGTLMTFFNETVGNLEDYIGSAGSVVISAGTLTSSGGHYVTDFTGAISGSGRFELSGGVQGLAGNSSYSGGTYVTNFGELFVGGNTALGTGLLTFDDGTEFSPSADVVLANNLVLNGSTNKIENDDGANFNMTLSGQISGTNGLEWCTPGTLTLSGNNTMAGGVDMREGNLILLQNSAAGTGPITLNNVSSLTVPTGVSISNTLNPTGTADLIRGSGTLSAPVTIDSHLALAPTASPGGGPGTLTFSGGLTLASGGELNFQLFDATAAAGTGYSLLSATGGLNLTAGAGAFTINVLSVDASGNAASALHLVNGTPYSWILATSSSPITGFTGSQFSFTTSGYLNSPGAMGFTVTESGNDLLLNFTPVPEPSTWALIAGGVFTLGFTAIRRRRFVRV